MESPKKRTQGMNWLSQHKRLAIYLRDGLACAYCGASVTDGAKLTLDHLTAYSNGGSNHESNLVTCCLTCNSSRGNRDYKAFADSVAAYRNHGLTGGMIVAHIAECVSREIDSKYAKVLTDRQGSCFKAIQAM